MAGSDLIVYQRGFQAAVDDAVAQVGDVESLDISPAAHLEHHDAAGHSDETHDALDPHFWLDPTRLADVGDTVADRLAELDPEHSQAYRTRARALRDRLEALDSDLAAGLRDCDHRTLVTAHDAFGYLANRYDLEQVGIAGLTPDQEPSAADLAAITRLVRDTGVTTVFTETLVSPAVAETVAHAAGVRTEVLDPIEGITDDSAGDDYLAIMRANLNALQQGLACQ
jgi:zinc transport system substrate-binding protein